MTRTAADIERERQLLDLQRENARLLRRQVELLERIDRSNRRREDAEAARAYEDEGSPSGYGW